MAGKEMYPYYTNKAISAELACASSAWQTQENKVCRHDL